MRAVTLEPGCTPNADVLIGAIQPFAFDAADDIEARDAAYECSCGANTHPLDRVHDCNCFGQRPDLLSTTTAPDLMTALSEAQDRVEKLTRDQVFEAALGMDGEFRLSELAERLGRAPATVSQHLRGLVEDGKLHAEGATKSRRFRVIAVGGPDPLNDRFEQRASCPSSDPECPNPGVPAGEGAHADCTDPRFAWTPPRMSDLLFPDQAAEDLLGPLSREPEPDAPLPVVYDPIAGALSKIEQEIGATEVERAALEAQIAEFSARLERLTNARQALVELVPA